MTPEPCVFFTCREIYKLWSDSLGTLCPDAFQKASVAAAAAPRPSSDRRSAPAASGSHEDGDLGRSSVTPVAAPSTHPAVFDAIGGLSMPRVCSQTLASFAARVLIWAMSFLLYLL